MKIYLEIAFPFDFPDLYPLGREIEMPMAPFVGLRVYFEVGSSAAINQIQVEFNSGLPGLSTIRARATLDRYPYSQIRDLHARMKSEGWV